MDIRLLKGSDMITSKGHSGTALLFAFIWAIVFYTPAWAAQFAGGTGEPNDPYQIATAEQLAMVGSDPELVRKHYVLTASIDLAGKVHSQSVILLFEGTFDGRGHTIRNLRIEGPNAQGLFGLIGDDGEVRNLGVVNVYVTGPSYPAGLVTNNMGRVLNCYSTGKVIGTGHAAGGLVGFNWNWGTVANSYSTATVEGPVFVGGLVGENAGTISFCHSTGDVMGHNEVGGLVGSNMGEITSSYCAATVSGIGWWVGGLVGYNSGKIISSYADATVTGEYEFVGGLVGRNGGLVSSCYSVGSVTGEDMVGGLVGDNEGKIATSYSAAMVMGYGRNDGGLMGLSTARAPNVNPIKDGYFLDPADGGGVDNKIGTPLTSADMKQQASFVGWDFWGTDADGASDVWFMPEDAYPVLAWQTEVTGLHAIPDVSGLPLDEARAALTAAGFVAGDISYDFHRSIPSGYVIRADPYSVAPAGATIGLVLSSGGTYEWTENPGDGTVDNPYHTDSEKFLRAC